MSSVDATSVQIEKLVAGHQHVAEASPGDRVRIGNIGGLGGSGLLYKHSHIEFYRGNTGLPSFPSRPDLRIDPSSVFIQPTTRKEIAVATGGQR